MDYNIAHAQTKSTNLQKQKEEKYEGLTPHEELESEWNRPDRAALQSLR
jgi:hypothetical protein